MIHVDSNDVPDKVRERARELNDLYRRYRKADKKHTIAKWVTVGSLILAPYFIFIPESADLLDLFGSDLSEGSVCILAAIIGALFWHDEKKKALRVFGEMYDLKSRKVDGWCFEEWGPFEHVKKTAN